MKPKTRLLLYHLLWTMETLGRPTYRNLTGSFESWAYRRGILRQIERLEDEGFLVTKKTDFNEKNFVRLTDAGRRVALGGRDPWTAWSEHWDGFWRIIIFDIPKAEHALRKRVDRALREIQCGHLQGSVWILPGEPAVLNSTFANSGKDCSHLLTLKTQALSSRENKRLVQAAWNFSEINDLYHTSMNILHAIPLRDDRKSEALLEWGRRENQAWLDAVNRDPLLPWELHPPNYLGPKAWKLRRTVLGKAGKAAMDLSHDATLHP